jgi:MFS family permease
MERKLRWYEHLNINSYVLGTSLASGIITPLLLPYLVVQFMPPELKNTYLATVRVVGLAVAMFVQPVAGMLSDRSMSPFGRRKPYILASALLNIIFLAIIATSPSFKTSGLNGFFDQNFGITAAYAVLLTGIILLQFSSNIGQAASQGMIPDVVPQGQRGLSSGIKAVFELLPSVLILVLGVGKMIDRGAVWAVIGVLMAAFLLTMLPTVLFVKEKPLETRPASKLGEPILRLLALTVIFVGITRAAIWFVQATSRYLTAQNISMPLQIGLAGLVGLAAMAVAIFVGVYFGAWVGIGQGAKDQKSFIWWVVNRLLFLAAVNSIQSFAMYFLSDVMHVANPGQATTILMAVVALFLIVSALSGGWLADRVGNRRLVGIAGLVATVGTILLILAPSLIFVYVAGCIIGLAAGTFMASSWALGTQLVPPAEAGRYMGISNLAGAGAGIVGSGIGGPLADFFNGLQPGLGYLIVFGIYAGLFLISTLTLGLVKKTSPAVAVPAS